MEISKVEELLVLKASLICLREKYYGMMATLNVIMNNIAISGINYDLNVVDKLIDKIDVELKRKKPW